MRPGVASQTAVYVCMGRAAAHQSTLVPGFSDPTALLLLPEEARRRVEQLRGGQIPRGARERWRYELLKRRALMMAVRTVAIDAALRETPVEQLVILGAGLDGRAWRMPELRDATVFELDHPDSQRQKRSRVSALTQTAREIRFAAVDFTKDSLDDVLESTTWRRR